MQCCSMAKSMSGLQQSLICHGQLVAWERAICLCVNTTYKQIPMNNFTKQLKGIRKGIAFFLAILLCVNAFSALPQVFAQIVDATKTNDVVAEPPPHGGNELG